MSSRANANLVMITAASDASVSFLKWTNMSNNGTTAMKVSAAITVMFASHMMLQV